LAAQKPTGRKKRRVREHVIADLSVNFLELQILRCGFSAERIDHDYGIDLMMFTYTADGEIENGHIEFQLKATDHLPLSADRQTIRFPVEFTDLRYWELEPMPVVLVVYDAVKCQAYWLHIQAYVDERNIKAGDEDDDRGTITMRIPVTNRVGIRAVRKFRELKEAALASVRGETGHGH
jgi:hypothetical protein